MKTRSSSGVGSKVDLAFDISGLRITDLEDDEDATPTNQTSAIYDKLTRKNEVTDKVNLSENAIVEKAIDRTDKLRSIIRKQD
jgi:hypothetical protein